MQVFEEDTNDLVRSFGSLLGACADTPVKLPAEGHPHTGGGVSLDKVHILQECLVRHACEAILEKHIGT